MTNKEALSAVRNSLQFLGPLATLHEALSALAGQDLVLETAAPAVEAARREREAAERGAKAAREAFAEEQRRLDALYRNGVEDVRSRVSDVEAQMSRDLERALAAGSEDVLDLEQQRAALASVVESLRAKHDSLQGQVHNLEGRIATLRADLAKIVQRAGGS